MVRRTYQRMAVLSALLAEPRGRHYGLEIAKAARLATGTIYPILARLEADGWVESEWEQIDESTEGRRRRRYYRLTGHGVRAARAELENVRRVVGGFRLAPGLTGGQA